MNQTIAKYTRQAIGRGVRLLERGDDMKDTILISSVLGRLMASLVCSVQVAEGESDELEQ